jgi:hypothetical protein
MVVSPTPILHGACHFIQNPPDLGQLRAFLPRLKSGVSCARYYDADLQFVFALQDGFYKGNGILATNKDLPVEVHFPGWKDRQNGQKRGDETF